MEIYGNILYKIMTAIQLCAIVRAFSGSSIYIYKLFFWIFDLEKIEIIFKKKMVDLFLKYI
jgi:hypothetical protein